MITITFRNDSDQRVVAAIRNRLPQIKQNLSRTLDSLMLELQQRIMRKVTGDVLQTHTGKGASSVQKLPVEDRGSQLIGKVTAGGGPAFYMRIQETGGTRSYQILPKNKKALAFFPTGSLGAGGGITPIRKDIIKSLYHRSGAKAGTLKPASTGKFGELGGVVVRSVIHPPLKARRFMASSIEEMRETIIDRLRASMRRSLTA